MVLRVLQEGEVAPLRRRPGDIPPLTEVEVRRIEAENLRRALRQTRWKIYGPDGAAELLGVKPTTLVSRIKKLGLKRGSEQAASAD